MFFNQLIVPIRLALFTLGILNVLTGFLLYRIGKIGFNENSGIMAGLIWLYNPFTLMIFLSGLETSIQVFLISLLTYFVFIKRKKKNSSFKDFLFFGIILSLIILSRLDGVLIFFSFIFLFVMKKIMHLRTKNNLKIKKIVEIFLSKNFLTLTLTPAITFLIWLLWSYYTLGIFTPISGAILRYRSASTNTFIQNVLISLKSFLMNIINLFFYSPTHGVLKGLMFLLLFIFPIILLFIILYKKREYSFLINLIKRFDFLILSFLLINGYYIFYQFHFRFWYFLFPSFLLIVLYSIILDYLYREVIKPSKIRLDKKKNYLKFFVISFFILNIVFGSYYMHTNLSHGYTERMKMINYIENNIPEDNVIGSFNTGFLQYYSLERDIINLDGVINSESYFALVNNYFIDYLKEKNLTYIIDNIEYVRWLNNSEDIELQIIKYFGNFTLRGYNDVYKHFFLFSIKYIE